MSQLSMTLVIIMMAGLVTVVLSGGVAMGILSGLLDDRRWAHVCYTLCILTFVLAVVGLLVMVVVLI